MKNTIWRRTFDIVYPVFLYLILSDCIFTILSMVNKEHGYSEMLLQVLTVVLSCPLILYIYWKDQKNGLQKTEEREEQCSVNLGQRIFRLILIVIASICLSVSLNNLILITGIIERSTAFHRVNDAFFSGGLFLELIGTAVITPLLEETLYRGIVFKRLRRYQSMVPSVILSAVIFGIMHFNIVQFIYAALIGLFLALVLETERALYVPVLAHGAANAVSVLRVETSFLSGLNIRSLYFVPVSVMMLVIAAIVIWYICRTAKKHTI